MAKNHMTRLGIVVQYDVKEDGPERARRRALVLLAQEKPHTVAYDVTVGSRDDGHWRVTMSLGVLD